MGRSVSRNGSQIAIRTNSKGHLLSTSDIENQNHSITDHNQEAGDQDEVDRPLT